MNPEKASPVMKKKWGISGSTLKLIAIITMLIDHIGAAVIEQKILKGLDITDYTIKTDPFIHNWVLIDGILRMIGRLAFPIFCFLLIEGFLHTKNVKKYALRLFAFCLISEIPFDLAFSGKLFDFQAQNVFFTLFIGLIVLIYLKAIDNYSENGLLKNPFIRAIPQIIAIILGMKIADILCTDYSSFGVFYIAFLYILRKKKVVQIAGGAASIMWEISAPFAFIPIAFYNGKRGLNLKYFFYLFYPVHLLILYGIAFIIPIP